MPLTGLIETNLVCTNEIILSEIIPSLMVRREYNLIEIFSAIERYKLDISWLDIREQQVLNLKNGINKVGIPDIIIAQNAKMHDLLLYSFDEHFLLRQEHNAFELFRE